jgi:hypothetical protein
MFSINASVGTEVQINGRYKGFNTYSAGVEAKLLIPRFMAPLHFRNEGGYVPRTTLMLGYDLLRKQKLYTMESMRARFGYNWRKSIQKEHELNLISLNYVDPLVVTQLYKDSAAGNRTLLKVVERQFILGSGYNYNYNGLAGLPLMSGGMYFNGNVDLSGNIAGLLTGASAKDGKQKNIFNAPFAQYIRLESDLRKYKKLSARSVWANRVIIGIGIPYGNSSQLPYIKQFFVGGTSSLRGFRSRSVGPGTYQDTISKLFLPDQSGDIKLELNTELRAKLFGILHGAIFLDAGNVWLFRKDTLKPHGEFSGKFLKELAVDAGIGFRFDVTFMMVRFDIAFPLRRPYPPGQEWIIDQVRVLQRGWRKQNIVYNLGIGYPF